MKINRLVNGVIVGDLIGKYEAGRKFRPVETIEFTEQTVNDRWRIRIPRFLAEYSGWWDTWEKERHLSMSQHLKPGMTFFDVGTSDGWQSILYALMLGGPQRMVLIEPTAEVWPNIKLIWEQNRLAMPKACYLGFLADSDTDQGCVHFGCWPDGPDYSHFLKGRAFTLLDDQGDAFVPRRKLDTLASLVRWPDAINVDVEGAELLVLRGAEETLKSRHPLVWVSVHPEFMDKGFHHTPRMLHEFMSDCGYNGKLLAIDHEEHHLFTANSN